MAVPKTSEHSIIEMTGMFSPRLRQGKEVREREYRIANHVAREIYNKRQKLAVSLAEHLESGKPMKEASPLALVENGLSPHTAHNWNLWMSLLITRIGGQNRYVDQVRKLNAEVEELKKKWWKAVILTASAWIFSFLFLLLLATFDTPTWVVWGARSIAGILIILSLFHGEKTWRKYHDTAVKNIGPSSPDLNLFAKDSDVYSMTSYTPHWKKK